MKKLCVISIYGKDGVLEDYIYAIVNEMKNYCDIHACISGSLHPDAFSKLSKLTRTMQFVSDDGFYHWGWKKSIQQLLVEKQLDQYDELILMNDLIYGPFNEIEPVFTKMDSQNIDFWGIINKPEVKNSNGEITVPATISSNFIVFKKSLFMSPLFEEYWDTQPKYRNFDQMKFEFGYKFTQYFVDKGFTYSTYIDTREVHIPANGECDFDHNYFNQYEMIEKGLPFIPKLSFSINYTHIINMNGGSELPRAINSIDTKFRPNIDAMFDSALRNNNIYDLYSNCGLHYILPDSYTLDNKTTTEILGNKKAAIVFHFYYEDRIESVKKWLSDVPAPVDVIVTTNTDSKMDLIKSSLSSLGSRLYVIKAPSKGRDIAGLLVAAKPFVKEYDYICFTHDKKSAQTGSFKIGDAFQDLLIDNTIISHDYINNVLYTLQNNNKLGLLCIPYPLMGIYYLLVGDGWTTNCDNVKKLCAELGIDVPISSDKIPLAMGTSIWFRTDALKPMFDVDWDDKLLPEPLPVDGTPSHAIERIFPYIAQGRGYLTGTIESTSFGQINHIRLFHMLYEITKTLREDNRYKNSQFYHSFEGFQNTTRELVIKR